jgi:hypothetical protein
MSPVADYLDALSRELEFDPALARRVRHEVEDHLRDAIEAEPGEPNSDAEWRAISRFGAAQDLAAQFKAASLHRRMKKTGALTLCAVAAIFAAMESRVIWYRHTQWRVSDPLKAASEIIVPIDRYAFGLAIVFGILGWLYSASRPVPATYRQACRDQFHRGQFLMGTAALAVAVAVMCEVLLTGWRLAEADWSVNALIPALTIVIEAVVVVAAGSYIHNTARRLAFCRIGS